MHRPTPNPLATVADAANAARASTWRDALKANRGNIAHASEAFGFTRARGHTLTKRHGLVEFAAALRAKNGQPKTGRPRGS